MEAFVRYLGIDMSSLTFSHHRLEVYADVGTEENRELVSLESLGTKIEA